MQVNADNDKYVVLRAIQMLYFFLIFKRSSCISGATGLGTIPEVWMTSDIVDKMAMRRARRKA